MNGDGPRIPIATVALIVMFAVLLAFVNNSALQRWMERPESERATDLDTGDLDRRTDRLGAGVVPSAEQPTVGREPEAPTAVAPSPVDEAQLLAVRERLTADLALRSGFCW